MTSQKYAIGRIRSIEGRMLDDNKFLRMSEADNFQAAFQVLNETDYAGLLNFDFETMLELSLNELKTLSDLLAPNDRTIKTFWDRYDYENIKVLIKAKREQENNPPLYKCGNIDPGILGNYILKGEGFVDKETKGLIDRAMQIKDNLKMLDFIDQNRPPLPALSENTKYFTSGIEPILLFLINKEEEIKKLGFILECKKNQIPSERIKADV